MPHRKSADFLTTAHSILSSGGLVSFPAKGFSMQPAIMDGDVLEAAPVAYPNLKKGDVLLYEDEEGKAVVHRLMGKAGRGGMLTLKGDAMVSFDRPVPADRILARIVAIERAGRRINLDSFYVRLVNVFRFHPLVRKLCRSIRPQ